MKRIWMRIGAEVKLSDRKYNELLEAQRKGDHYKLKDMVESMTHNYELSGETYILGKNNGFDQDYDNPEEEISVLF